ncbi:M23 family metallopeptidase [Microbacterium sp. X-17]|uniref:murein hydrolase activator EnvC family protein n=1 Tax=Microbacterium sp. X-17 TaxID=3144404 RepID=UPI0031F51A6D
MAVAVMVAVPVVVAAPMAAVVGLAGVGAPGDGSPGSMVDVEFSPRSTAASSTISRVSPRWSWPLAPLRMVRPYEAPPSPYAAGHRGIDLAAAPGATVTAPSEATVHFVGVVVDRPVLTLDHGSGVLSSYEPVVAAGLAVGDPVTRGMVLGVVGEGAHCSGACLHVGVRVDGEYVSPLLFFDRPPRAVLLPQRPGGASRAATHDRPVRRGDGRGGRSP